ncbi:hypothetical protein Cgig2_024680 [Carnegiea gigantea]|uniref:Uncharacterized protein n=1 Tax=Carnegiea gigantea TaxID=171969 RepID=A0A9Q1K006_9CARY|nr:hypothetical protein Cgig2_024680 [Carnegiea gigantea]
MATCSSVALGGSVELEGTRSRDLERCSTKADFTGRSTLKIHSLGRCLPNRSPVAARKKSLSNLGGQFRGSLSLDLTYRRLGSLPTIWDMKDGKGVGRSQVVPTYRTVYKEKIVLPVLQLELLLNSRHEALSIVETVLTSIPNLTRGRLYSVSQLEHPAGTREPTQLTHRNKGGNIVPGCRHNLRRRQFIFV